MKRNEIVMSNAKILGVLDCSVWPPRELLAGFTIPDKLDTDRRGNDCIGELTLLSGVPDYFDRNKISSGGDLSHYSSASLFINHIFQFYYELCTYCNILDIYLSQNFNFVNYVLFYMKLLNYLFFNMFGSVLESCELTGVCLLLPWLIKWK